MTAQDLKNAGAAFDGFVIDHVRGRPKWESLSSGAFTDITYTLDPSDPSSEYIGDDLNALEKLPPDPMPVRFLRINTSPLLTSHFDWFDDRFWDNVVHNLTVASEMVEKAHLTGIFLDTEQYKERGNPNLYLYDELRKDPKYAGKSYNDLAAEVEKRGNQVIEALNSHAPNTTIFTSFGYLSVVIHGDRHRMAAQGFLLDPFLDGLLAGSTHGTTFIDGYEQAYWHDDTPDFFARYARTSRHAGTTSDFEKYTDRFADQYQFGPGLYLDRDNAHGKIYGWCGDGRDNIFYSPARLAFTVQQAVKAADEYVWIYSQKPNAWLSPDSAKGLPSVYAQAIREGQDRGNNPSGPQLSPNTSSVAESAICK